MNTIPYAYTQKGTRLPLSPLGSGGEGTVYEIVGYKKVAKIYHPDTDVVMNKRHDKIDAMVEMKNSTAFQSANLSDDIAWPLAPLFDDKRKFIGFGMDKISASTELDDLYVYPPQNNIQVSTKDRITCLISICDIIERLHQTGQVFGDFNPNNIKINSDWSACFVDADSYHINRAGKEYRCIACAPGYVAPEVIRSCKGSTYADCPGTTFTKESDRFSLAIHIFRMLMNGCHPFGCERQMRRSGSAPAPKPIDKRVENGETPFFKTIPNFAPPSYSPDINSLPPYIRDLFRQAFVDGHSNPSMRPAISEWKNALIRYRSELTICKYNSSHYYWKGNRSCPYCTADQRFSAKMGHLQNKVSAVPANSTNVAPAPKTNANNANVAVAYSGNTYQPPKVASNAVAAPKTVNTASFAWFWAVTVTLTVIMQILLGVFVFPGIYKEFCGDETISMIGIVGSTVAGIVGMIIYNIFWAPGKTIGRYSWWEYCLSILTAIGFSIGFGVAMGLIYIAIMLIVGIIILAIVFGIFAGG